MGPSGTEDRLVITSAEERDEILRECHENPGSGGHQGQKRTLAKVEASYYWCTITQDVSHWVSMRIINVEQ